MRYILLLTITAAAMSGLWSERSAPVEIRSLPKNKVIPHKADTIELASEAYGVDTNLIRAVIHVESRGRNKARSHKGAVGLMQLMPNTAKMLKVDPNDPTQNIMGGTKYLGKLSRRYKGNIRLALAAYNAGPTNVTKYGGVPPFEETQNYVERVMQKYTELRLAD